MNEKDGDDALNMPTLKELHFRRELTFADTVVFCGLPSNSFSAKRNNKDINHYKHKLLRHRLLRFLPEIAIKMLQNERFLFEPQ